MMEILKEWTLFLKPFQRISAEDKFSCSGRLTVRNARAATRGTSTSELLYLNFWKRPA
jgi:hypothetical protein